MTTFDNWEKKREEAQTTDDGDATLDSYRDLEPPRVSAGKSITTPRHAKIAGRVGRDHARDQRVYVSPRSPGYHFFERFGGWGVSVAILDKVREMDVQRVLIQEKGESKRGTDNVYEYTIDQFVNAEEHWSDGPDPQRVVPVEEAVAVWEGYARDLWGWTQAQNP